MIEQKEAGDDKTNLGSFHILDDRNRFGLDRSQLACAGGFHCRLFSLNSHRDSHVDIYLAGDVVMKYKAISPWAEHWTGESNAVFVSFLTMASNWLAPIPEAAMTGSAIVTIFDLPAWLGYVVAASIEIAGFGVNSYYLEALAFNEAEEAYKARTNRKTYRLPLENIESARKAVIWFYVVTGCVVGFNAIYQVVTKAAQPIMLLAILFPVVSALATIAANRRAALHRKQVRNNDTVIATSTKRSATIAQPKPKPAPIVNLNERQIAMIDLVAAQPEITYTKLGETLGVSRTTASNDMKRLILAGKLGDNGRKMPVKVEEVG